MTFDEWLAGADRLVESCTGLSLHDFPDWAWRDAYDNGDTPAQAADEFLTLEAEELGLDLDELLYDQEDP